MVNVSILCVKQSIGANIFIFNMLGTIFEKLHAVSNLLVVIISLSCNVPESCDAVLN